MTADLHGESEPIAPKLTADCTSAHADERMPVTHDRARTAGQSVEQITVV
ncbi:hypothetical protein ACQPYE_28715 [Actinosynnema sp. CA-299493]